MIENISLDYFKIFYEVAKQKNITRASEVLFISQPAITQTINKLEEKLGMTLLLRNKRGVELTKNGEEIFKRLEYTFSGIGSIDKYLRDEKSLTEGTITIGCGGNIGRKVLVKPIKEFLDKYSNITIKQIDEPQNLEMKKLFSGEVDLIISQYNENVEFNFDFVPLLEEQYVFICTKRYYEKVLAKGNKATYIVIGEGSFCRNTFDDFVKENLILPKSLIRTVGYNMAIDLCLNDVGVTLVPTYLVESLISDDKLIIINKDLKLPKVEFGYYINKPILTSATKAFLEFLGK